MTTMTGRSAPYTARVEPEHDVRIHCNGDHLSVRCEPCNWRTWIDNGHTPDDLKRLERMHTGEPQ